jgi:hypothetical protein
MTVDRRPAVGPWLLLLLGVFALEFFVFDQFGSRRHTGVYPKWNDQVQYLSDGYTAWEHARTHGFLRSLGQTLINPSAQGTLHDTAALLIFQLAGSPSRSAALALNLLALIAWQLALFLAVQRIAQRPSLAFAAALLPLALAGPWENIPGSAYDFRLDHFAMCTLGVAGAVALLTDGFRSRAWSVLFGLAVALTLLLRFLTGTYFILIFAGLLAWILARLFREARNSRPEGADFVGANRDKVARPSGRRKFRILFRLIHEISGLSGPDRRARSANLAWAAGVAFVLTAPFFWINRATIYEYYWIGHYLGPESAIRNQNFGVGRSLAFITQALAERHLGWFFGVVALLGAVGLAGGRGRRAVLGARATAVVGLIWLIAPAIVLLLHQQKSDVVVSAMAPGAVLLVIALWLRVARAPREGRPIAAFAINGVLCGLVLAFFVQRQLRPADDPTTFAHIRQVNTIADTLFARIQAAGLERPAIGVDHITDCLDARVLRVLCYERNRAWLPLEGTLPISIAEPDGRDVMARLERSHFVFLTESGPEGLYPYDRKMAALRPELRAWCEAHLVLIQRFDLLDRRVALYQRREIALLPNR